MRAEGVYLCAVRNVRRRKRVESRSARPTTPVTWISMLMLMLMLMVTYSLSVDGVKRKENRRNKSWTRGHAQAAPVLKHYQTVNM